MEELNKDSEVAFKKLYDSLGEKDSRRLAGTLYKLTGSLKYTCDLLQVSHKTVHKGSAEIDEERLPCPDGQRTKGGGRKAKWDDEDLNSVFKEVIEPYVAGDPMNDKVKWTNLSRSEITELMKERGFSLSKNTVGKLLKNNGFKKRKIQKRKSLKRVKDRDAQFQEINAARNEFTKSGDPIISIDTKKKSL